MPQRGLGPGKITRSIETLVYGDRLIEELASTLHAAPPREGGARVVAGERELKRPRPAGAGADSRIQDVGVIFDQSPAAQRGTGDPGHLVAGRDAGDRGRDIPGPARLPGGQPA